MTVLVAVNGRMCRGKALHLLMAAFEEREREEMEERGRDGEIKGGGEGKTTDGNVRQIKTLHHIDAKILFIQYCQWQVDNFLLSHDVYHHIARPYNHIQVLDVCEGKKNTEMD